MALDVGLISGDAVFHNVPGLVVHEPREGDDRALQYVPEVIGRRAPGDPERY